MPSASPALTAENPTGEISPAESISALDDNYEFFKQSQNVEYDEKEFKRVLRKIDLRIVPILFVTYLMQYLDKNSLNFASVYGLKEGTHLVGQDYSWLGKLLYPFEVWNEC